MDKETILKKAVKKIMNQIWMLSIFVFLVACLFSSQTMILVFIIEKDEYHKSGLILHLVGFLLGSTLANSLLKKPIFLKYNSLILCAILHFINLVIHCFVLAQIVESQVFLKIIDGVGCLIGGVGSGFLFVIYGIYLNFYCKKMNVSERGKMISCSNCIIESRSLLITITIFFKIQNLSYTLISSFLCLLAIALAYNFIAIVGPDKYSSIIFDTLEELEEKTEDSGNLKCNKYWEKIKKLKNFILLAIYVGNLSGYIPSFLVYYEENIEGQANLGKMCFLISIGAIVGSLVAGKVSDYIFDKRNSMLAGILFAILSSVIVIFVLIAQTHLQVFTSLIMVLTSFTISYLICFMMYMCSIFFKGDGQKFGIIRQIIIVSCFVHILLFGEMNSRDLLMIRNCLLNFLCIASIYCVLTFTPSYKFEKKEDIAETVQEV